eukprot:986646-Pyramimonas_sp.AAC.2
MGVDRHSPLRLRQSRKGRENIPITGTNCRRGKRICPARESYIAHIRTREEEREVYRRCKTARQTDLRVMLAGPKGRAVGESGELDTG